jgi:hypothetical protein
MSPRSQRTVRRRSLPSFKPVIGGQSSRPTKAKLVPAKKAKRTVGRGAIKPIGMSPVQNEGRKYLIGANYPKTPRGLRVDPFGTPGIPGSKLSQAKGKLRERAKR